MTTTKPRSKKQTDESTGMVELPAIALLLLCAGALHSDRTGQPKFRFPFARTLNYKGDKYSVNVLKDRLEVTVLENHSLKSLAEHRLRTFDTKLRELGSKLRHTDSQRKEQDGVTGVGRDQSRVDQLTLEVGEIQTELDRLDAERKAAVIQKDSMIATVYTFPLDWLSTGFAKVETL